jgi:hypothetical protein
MRMILSILIALLCTAPASAELIEFTFTGEVEVVQGLPPAPWADVTVGTPWELRYIFDSEAPDQDDGHLFGIYEGLSASIIVGDAMAATTEVEIEVDLLVNIYRVEFPDYLPGGFGAIELVSGSNPLPDDSLPTNLQLSEFSTQFIELGDDVTWYISGPIQTFTSQVIPAPAVFAMLLGGAVIPHSRRRSSSRLRARGLPLGP